MTSSREVAKANCGMGSLSQLAYHIVFGTKRREPTITEDFRDRLYEYIGGIARNEKATLVAIGGVSDHVQLLVLLPPTVCIADFARGVKANSSKWVREAAKPNHDFAWQKGYSAFSVIHSNIDAVQRYIRNQRAHYRSGVFGRSTLNFSNGMAFSIRRSTFLRTSRREAGG